MRLIKPASLNVETIRQFTAAVRSHLDAMEAELHLAEEKPHQVIYVFINRAALIGELCTNNIRAWAVEWMQSGAPVATAAKAARMSPNGINYWRQKRDDEAGNAA